MEVERVRLTGALSQLGSLVLVPVLDDHQAVAGVTGSVLRETTQAADDRDVLASVSHELRNPLSTLSTLLQAQMLRGPTDELHMMHRALQQVTRIVDNIVESSALMHERVVLQRQTAELATVIQRATELAGTATPVHVAAPSTTVLVEVDVKRLTRAIANLIANAAATAPRGARVSASIRQHADRVEVRISNDGGQSSSEPSALAANRIDPGLRLAHQNARGIVELHGGSVSLVDAPGNAPESVITLPVSTAALVERAVTSASESKRVLLVEDNDEGARALEAALVLRGYQVALAHNAPLALTLAKTFKPDVVLVDLGLPVMDGWELAKRLRVSLSELPMVAVTARDQPSDFQRSAELGFAEHLVKPIDVTELDRVVRRIAT